MQVLYMYVCDRCLIFSTLTLIYLATIETQTVKDSSSFGLSCVEHRRLRHPPLVVLTFTETMSSVLRELGADVELYCYAYHSQA
jgi:hypothetical protein